MYNTKINNHNKLNEYTQLLGELVADDGELLKLMRAYDIGLYNRIKDMFGPTSDIPTTKTRIHVEEMKKLCDRIRAINKLKIEDIDFYENSIKLVIHPNILKTWKNLGLCNMDFVITDYYTHVVDPVTQLIVNRISK